MKTKAAPANVVLEHLSDVPSAGKTYTIIKDELEPHVLAEDHPGFIKIYVGLTHQLCKEVYRNLRKPLVIFEEDPTVIYLEENSVSALSYLLGVITADAYRSADTTRGSRNTINEASKSKVRVVICTHECFWRVPLIHTKEMARAHVFFDEARDCAFSASEIHLSYSSMKNLLCAFKMKVPVEDKEVVRVVGGAAVTFIDRLYTIQGNKFPETKTLLEVFDVKSFKDLPADIIKFTNMMTASNFDRLEVLLSTTFRKDPQGSTRRTVEMGSKSFVVGVARPSRIFEGYGRVVVMSAYFEYSQMYAMLKHGHLQGGKMYDLVPYKRTPAMIRRSEKMTALAVENIRIGSLLAGDHKTVTSTMLSTGLIVPRKFNRLMTASGSTLSKSAVIKRIFEGRIIRAEALPNLSADEVEYVNDTLARLANPPALAMHRIAFKCFDRVLPPEDELKREGLKRKALCFFNSESGGSRASVYYIGGYTQGKKPDIKVAHLLNNLASKLETQDGITDGMRAYLNHSIDFFEYASTSAHGLNKYSDHPAVVHLAGMNMAPATAHTLKRAYPGYDPEMDKVISNIIQTGFRGAIRDEDNRHPYYFLVGSEYLIERVEELCFAGRQLQRIENHKPTWTILDYQSANKGDQSAKGKLKKGKTKHTPEVADQLKKARVCAYTAKTQKTRDKWEAEVKRLMALSAAQNEKRRVKQ